MAPFTDLATELLWIIVDSISQRDLHSCTLVNKQLYIATNHLLWRFRQLPDGDTADTILEKATTEYHPVGQWIQKLELCFSYWTDVRLLDLIDNNLDQLEELHLDNTMNLTDQSLIHLARRSPTLKQVYLFQVPKITQRFMDALGYYCLQLNKLDFHLCTGLGGDSYSALQNCPIQVMHISEPPSILQTEMAMWDLIVHYPMLTELKLTMAGIGGARFMEQLLSAAAGAWPYLTTLALEYYVSPLPSTHIEVDEEDDSLVAFLTYHPGIERLHFRQCNVWDHIWDHIADLGLPCLEELIIDNRRQLTPDVTRRLVYACPQLFLFTFRVCCNWPLGLLQNDGDLDMDTIHRGRRHNCEYLNFVHHLYQEDINKIRDSGVLPDTAMATSTRATMDTPPRATRAAMSRTPWTATPSTMGTSSRTITTTSSHTTADTPRRLTPTTRSRVTMATTSRTPRTTTRSAIATSSRTITTTPSHTTTDTPRRLTSTAPSRARVATTSRTPRTTTPSTTGTSPRSITATSSRAIATTVASSRTTMATPRTTTAASPRTAAAAPSRTATSTPRTATSTPRTTTVTAPRSTTFTRRTTTTSSDTATSTPSRITTTSPSRAISTTPRTTTASFPRSTTTTPRATAASSRTTTATSSQTTATSARTITTTRSKPATSTRTITSSHARSATFSSSQKATHLW